jgi:hypothetical protein
MRNVQLYVLPLLALLAPFVACAAGDVSPDLGPGTVTPQSNAGNDGGITQDDAATPTPVPTPPSEDASAPTPSVDANPPTPPTPTIDASMPPTPPMPDAAPPPVDSAPPPAVDSGNPPASCPGYADPSTVAGCYCNPAQHACTANGCYNGYYCELSLTKCVVKPAGC